MNTHKRTQRSTVVALCAGIALLFALPSSVQAQGWDVTVKGPINNFIDYTDPDTGIKTDAGLFLSGDKSKWIGMLPGDIQPSAVAGENWYLFPFPNMRINLTGTFTNAGGVAGILTDDYYAKFYLDKNDVTVSGTATGDMRGFLYVGKNVFEGNISFIDPLDAGEFGIDPDSENFADFFLVGANISVTNNGAGNAMGVLFWNPATNAVQNIEFPFFNLLNFGNITVSSKNDAWGFWAGDVGPGGVLSHTAPALLLGNITVTATGTTPNNANDHATGIQLGKIGSFGLLPDEAYYLPFMTTGNITVTTDRLNAFGILAESLNSRGIGNDGNTEIGCFGEIKVTSTNGAANAIAAGISITAGDANKWASNFYLRDNITVKAESGKAWGIRSQSPRTRIHILDDVTINVSGADNNIGVEANDLTIWGMATADLGRVIANGNVIIGSGIDWVDVIVGEGSEFKGNANELHKGSSLKLDFIAPEGGKIDGFGTWTVMDGTLITPSGTAEYYFDENGNIAVRRATIKSDTYLAAAMIHNRFAAYTMVRDKFISNEPRRGGYFGQVPYPYQAPFHVPTLAPYQSPYGAYDPHEISPFGKKETQGTSWLSYVGRANQYGNWNLGANGVQIGSDLYVTNRNQLGIIFGYEEGWARKDFDQVESEDIFVGLYAARIFRSGADFRFIYNYGWQSFDMERHDIVNNIFFSKFKGHTQELTLEFGKRYHWDAWSLRPSIATDLYLNHLDSTVESGGVVYEKLDITQCFLRFGMDFRYQYGGWVFNTGLSHAYDVNDPELRTVANGLPLQGSKPGRQVWLYNFNVECQVFRNLSIFGGYDAQIAAGRSNTCQHIGFFGGVVRW